MFYINDFCDNLDKNPHLLGFNNGIFDFRDKGIFRDGKISDYVSKSVGYDYIPYDNIDKSILKEIKIFMKSIQPNKETRKYLLKKMSKFLVGNVGEEYIFIFLGKGRNGKSLLITDILMKILGKDYSEPLNVGHFTHKADKPTGANPDLVDLKGIRLATSSETNSNENFNVAFAKYMSGGDIIKARRLNENPVKFKPMFHLIIGTNVIPKIDTFDDATVDRFIIINFPVKFKYNPNPDNEFEKKIDKKLKSKVADWIPTFASYLIHIYYNKKFNDDKFTDEIIKVTNNFWNSNDFYREFIGRWLEHTDNMSDYIKIDDLYKKFIEWYKLKFQYKKIVECSQLEDYLNKNNEDYDEDNRRLYRYVIRDDELDD